MKISLKWLSDWVDLSEIAPSDLADQLTMAGLEVESVTSLMPVWSSVCVARIISCEPHPQAERLQICQVDAGDGASPLQIVCGAPNAREGILVPLAKIGTKFSDQFKIKKAKLRGIESFGMLCSTQELGLSDDAEGLLEFPADAPLGTSLIDYFQLDDHVIEMDLTPNRGDCLSVLGVARELSVLLNTPTHSQEQKESPVTSSLQRSVALQAPADAPKYLGRVIEGVNAQAATPLWIAERLRRSGVRSLSLLVDITNYVMLELGQPMHAFDLEKLSGDVIVRRASDQEKLTLLDGKEITMDSSCLVIADTQRAIALAGVMGGSETAVDTETKNVFLESAFFTPTSIAGRARRFGLHTDASHRYERGVDPEITRRALERATELIIEIAGGSAGPLSEAISVEHLPQERTITLRENFVEKLLGIAIEPTEIERILTQLGMNLRANGDHYEVTPPLFRFDLNLEVDLVEELGRIYGYNHLPMTRFQGADTIRVTPEAQRPLSLLKRTLIDAGMHEVITYSFVHDVWQKELTEPSQPLKLANPISEEMNVMRTSLWPGLLSVAKNNLNRQEERVRIFESGLIFHRQEDEITQTPVIGGLILGDREAESWNTPEQKVDFYDIKGVVEQLIALTGDLDSYRFVPSTHPALHPGQCADLYRNEVKVGTLGAIHPQIAHRHDLPKNIYLFEIKLENIIMGRLSAFRPLSKFPSVRRDLAFIVKDQINADQLIRTAKEVAPELIESAYVFDQFKGKNIEEGYKSIALAIKLHDLSRTLVDSEVDKIISTIIQELGKRFDATLRK